MDSGCAWGVHERYSNSSKCNQGSQHYHITADALQVPAKVLNSYRIVKVEAPEAGVTMFVVRSRKSSSTQPLLQQQQLPQGTGSSSSSSSGGAEGGESSPVQLPGTEAEAAATIKACKVI
jgi:hypothetical protein